jgi:uncharacterized protein YaaW (UPF0174 family)
MDSIILSTLSGMAYGVIICAIIIIIILKAALEAFWNKF